MPGLNNFYWPLFTLCPGSLMELALHPGFSTGLLLRGPQNDSFVRRRRLLIHGTFSFNPFILYSRPIIFCAPVSSRFPCESALVLHVHFGRPFEFFLFLFACSIGPETRNPVRAKKDSPASAMK